MELGFNYAEKMGAMVVTALHPVSHNKRPQYNRRRLYVYSAIASYGIQWIFLILQSLMKLSLITEDDSVNNNDQRLRHASRKTAIIDKAH